MTALIRHAKTEGNLKKKYIGITDEPIINGTRADKKYPEADIVISSPMRRCIETAELIYPGIKPKIYDGLAETNFGKFENRSYDDLKDDPLYKEWLASSGTLPFPGGESSEAFRKRFDPLKDDYHYPISLIYSRKRQLTNAEKNFVKFIQDYKQ